MGLKMSEPPAMHEVHNEIQISADMGHRLDRPRRAAGALTTDGIAGGVERSLKWCARVGPATGGFSTRVIRWR